MLSWRKDCNSQPMCKLSWKNSILWKVPFIPPSPIPGQDPDMFSFPLYPQSSFHENGIWLHWIGTIALFGKYYLLLLLLSFLLAVSLPCEVSNLLLPGVFLRDIWWARGWEQQRDMAVSHATSWHLARPAWC